eukprot:1158303-Pyramimonas_sp.AAC.1
MLARDIQPHRGLGRPKPGPTYRATKRPSTSACTVLPYQETTTSRSRSPPPSGPPRSSWRLS